MNRRLYWGLAIIIIITFISEMCIFHHLIKPRRQRQIDNHFAKTGPKDTIGQFQHDNDIFKTRDGYTVGLYFSNWSPYKPRRHFPHDIDLSRVSHIYYAFFVIDGKKGILKSSDPWADFEMDLYKPLALKFGQRKSIPNAEYGKYKKILPMGVIGELFFLKNQEFIPQSSGFKTIMCIGGWSNRDQFPLLLKGHDSSRKIDRFVDSAINQMFQYGFDGIEIDWEFPEDNEREPSALLEIVRKLRQKMNHLEHQIFGDNNDHPCFHLSLATPAFHEKLSILPIAQLDQFLDIWNMMTYDYHGEWSETTGYHSNLYGAQNNRRVSSNSDVTSFSSNESSSQDGNLCGDDSIQYMIEHQNIASSKVNLGMAAYGRGFTKVKSEGNNYINKKFNGVGGASEGEPGMWLYNQLPISGSLEQFDSQYVSAFCYDPATHTFIGYDNVDSMRIKSQYVKDFNLGGGFWWESCGDVHDQPNRSLLKAFTDNLPSINKPKALIFSDERVLHFYIKKFGDNGFLSKFIAYSLQTSHITK